MVAQYLPRGRIILALNQRRKAPKPGALDCFRAVQLCLLNFNQHYRSRQAPVEVKSSLERRVRADARGPIDAQHVLKTRHEKQQRDSWIADDVDHAIEPVVAWAV